MTRRPPHGPHPGTVCHRGHEMQATCEAFVSLSPSGRARVVGKPAFSNAHPPFGRTRLGAVYCQEDCPDIPAPIVEAARERFLEAFPPV